MKRLFIATILLYSGTVLVDFLVSRNMAFHYGKDGGLIFRWFSLCMLGSIYFYVSTGDLLGIGIGFFVGLLSYLAYFFIQLPWTFSMFQDQLITTTIVFLIGCLYTIRNWGNNKKPET